jgi:16S rRNA processing protein RimM
VTRPRPALLSLGTEVRIGGRTAEVVRRAGTDDRPIVRLAGVGTREAAEALRGAELAVARASAPPLDEDEWYAEDLVGLRVVDGERAVGVVERLVPLPSCEALEVARGDGGSGVLVPLVRDCVRRVDVSGGVVDVDLAYLGETLPDDLAPDRDPGAEPRPAA